MHVCCRSEKNAILFLFRYQSQPTPLGSVEEVNQWVENVTNGHISNFLESIPHDVVLILMNAVYFKGEHFHQRLVSMVIDAESQFPSRATTPSFGVPSKK